jgi:hypothetical protein
MKSVKQEAAEARAAGDKRFISERPCRYGHPERYADKQGKCVDCDRCMRILWSRRTPHVLAR